MSDVMTLPPLPFGDHQNGQLYTADQMRAYGEQCARAAVKERLGEPVAWRWSHVPDRGRDMLWHFGPDFPPSSTKPVNVEPLYCAPSYTMPDSIRARNTP